MSQAYRAWLLTVLASVLSLCPLRFWRAGCAGPRCARVRAGPDRAGPSSFRVIGMTGTGQGDVLRGPLPAGDEAVVPGQSKLTLGGPLAGVAEEPSRDLSDQIAECVPLGVF